MSTENQEKRLKPTIQIPKNNSKEMEEFGSERNLVLVGANGSGKSKLGAWIEGYKPNNEKVQSKIIHRVSAQRALNIPQFIAMMPLERSKNALFHGEQDPPVIDPQRKINTRWNRNPTTQLINDINFVMSALFAEQRKRDNIYTEKSRGRANNHEITLTPPLSLIDIMKEICNEIFPYLPLVFDDEKISVKVEGMDTYMGGEMSDGERVAIYLLGQCLLIPQNSVIIIDEPEIHLHKSLMSRLWDKVEEIKEDCLFIYITHDLDFASSRSNADKLWIKKFIHPNKWEWEIIPKINDIPENLVLQIIGNRKNVIFIEGELDKLDYKIYQKIFDDYLVVPVGGCQQVITSVKGMAQCSSLHYLKGYGIIDRDYRNDEEIHSLKSSDIYTLKVAEIENFLCTENVVRIISDHLGLNSDEVFNKVKEFVLKELKSNFETQISRYTAIRIQSKLNLLDKKAIGKEKLEASLNKLITNIDVSEIYDKSTEIFESIIKDGDYKNALKYYNERSILKRISKYFGLNNGKYEELVVRLLYKDQKDELVTALKDSIPEF
ncbi:hypothetical protein LCGC14_0616430 [marine sediment metagenome]|uniref:DUF4435 domain-containing protein n=1 Tax=marine sediment metagenome TaxID=412755 RepID=A0A0F9UEM2_9ZZZZ|nr:DUF4435 domain-containing protein [bacterium]